MGQHLGQMQILTSKFASSSSTCTALVRSLLPTIRLSSMRQDLLPAIRVNRNAPYLRVSVWLNGAIALFWEVVWYVTRLPLVCLGRSRPCFNVSADVQSDG
ncbi:MAG: hypothetical protein AB4352_22590 [Hormoscilla sp.]